MNAPHDVARRRLLGGGLAALGTALLSAGAARRAAAASPGAGSSAAYQDALTAARALKPLTVEARPITAAEHAARLAQVQALMQRAQIGALLLEPGASLLYFTGLDWWRSERITAALVPAEGEVLVVTPEFEEPSVRETLAVPAEVRIWSEHESPFARLAQGLKDRRIHGPLAIEETVRFLLVDGLHRGVPGLAVIPAEPLVRPCRMIKSPAELSLLEVANAVTLAALRFARKHLSPGLSAEALGSIVEAATRALGGFPEFTLVLLNEASAYPHGTHRPEVLREGSTVLLDCGCSVYGYQSDISRTFVYGEPNAEQRRLWALVHRGQALALETARPGVPVGSLDDAVRSFYEREGFGPGYRLPGLPHRTGHGIGLEGHEPPYLVHGDTTALAAGMCFSDEPGLYIPGKFGVRLEDCWHMTEQGPVTFTPLARSIEEPL